MQLRIARYVGPPDEDEPHNGDACDLTLGYRLRILVAISGTIVDLSHVKIAARRQATLPGSLSPIFKETDQGGFLKRP